MAKKPAGIARKIKGIGVTYYLWGKSPIQGFGEVRSKEFRFQAQGGEWVFEVADWDGVLPSAGGKNVYVRRGSQPQAVEMSHDEAVKLVEMHVRDYFSMMD